MDKSRIYLCYLLNINSYTLNHALERSKYRLFKVKKKSGGDREISAPDNSLKYVQRKINEYITNNYEFLSCQNGFVKGRSITDNARAHVGAKYILNIDLKDFFPTINFGRVRGMFMAEPFNLNNAISTLLAKLTCNNNQLPQGSPCSPAISNIICYTMDKCLLELSKKYCFAYSRYADDMTISSNQPLPKEIAYRTVDNYVIIGKKLRDIIEKQGFSINESKTNLSRLHERKEVTGLIVNEKVNVKKIYVKELRSLLHNAETKGLYDAAKIYFVINDKKKFINSNMLIANIRKVIEGKLNFLKMVRGSTDLLYLKYHNQYIKILEDKGFFRKTEEEYQPKSVKDWYDYLQDDF